MQDEAPDYQLMIEKGFQQIETDAKFPVEKLCSGQALSTEERDIIAWFAAIHAVRNPRQEREHHELMSEVAKKKFIEAVKVSPDKIIEEMKKKEPWMDYQMN